ncbi:MAG: GspH/FimT family pseudopilin [Azoarcus sp.]|jgi:prepilin-type N-terminal cleavage/methylation domain-containing protein|nr:GspH/FimT family pseudopilin [Azoarcus sp.]
MNAKKYLRGFTLIELMATIAVAGIMLAVAAPGLANLMRQNRIATASSDLVGSMTYTRGEAVRRGKAVSLCPAAGGLHKGWTVQIGSTCASSNIVLVERDELTGIDFPGGAITAPLTVNPMGVAKATWLNDGFVIQAAQCKKDDPGARRALTFSPLLEIDAARQACQ